MKNLLEHVGIELERLHFSWISSSEAGKFAEVAAEVVGKVREAGPIERLVKGRAEVI